MRKLLLIGLFGLLEACVAIPDGIQAVRNFDAQTYMGRWYEIARLENSFETGLEQISAHYSRREDGGLRVVNQGYDTAARQWKTAEGRAYFVGQTDEGRLKVSFFGPFYGAYNIVELDPQYQYSLVCGADKSYLWLLARTPRIPEPVLRQFIAKAQALGFATDQLIYPKQAE